MNVKREISTSVEDLMQDGIKRLAISHDGHPVTVPPVGPAPSVEGFRARFELLREVGKGGFSTVYLCRERLTGDQYAVKVVDLRPLRLRGRDPARLRREVEIMQRLSHPNIVRFEAVFEDADQLMVVMGKDI
jgi:serine/threonine protein kinase